jgi:hypothetical protein
MRANEEKSSQQCKLVTSLKDTREEKQVDMFADWLIDDIHKEETTKD